MISSMRSQQRAALLLLALAAVSQFATPAAAAADCPDLFSLSTPEDARQAVVRDCTGAAAAGSCDACQCSLVKVVTPWLVASRKVLSSEAWMPSSLNSIADTLAQCRKVFAVQILENTNTTLTQLASFDACPYDVKAVSQCISNSKPADASAAGSSNSSSNSNATVVATDGDSSMAQEVMQEACAATVEGGCPSTAAARMVAGAPLSSGGGMVFAPVLDGASVLEISAGNTRGSIVWKALCWCDETWDPVCDADTRKQYPNTCSAQCQNVTRVVPCSSLQPLVNQTMAGNTPVFVVDQSLMAPSPAAAAFAGPTPPEAPEDSQSFYYYYEDDADDTQDAMEIASTLAEAFLAARFGDEVSAVDAVAKSLPGALQAGLAASGAAANVTKANGPADNTTAGPLAALRNITITRQRFGLDRSAQGQADRRNVAVPAGDSMYQPGSPSWLLTSAPGYSAGVYQRDADRTSRILASLMAAAQEAKNNTRAAGVVGGLAPGLDNLVKAAQGAVEAARKRLTPTNPAGGMFRSANLTGVLGNMTASLNSTATNMTSLLGDLLGSGNSTANSTNTNTTSARPSTPRMVDSVNNTKPSTPQARGNGTSGRSSGAGSQMKQPKRRFLFF